MKLYVVFSIAAGFCALLVVFFNGCKDDWEWPEEPPMSIVDGVNESQVAADHDLEAFYITHFEGAADVFVSSENATAQHVMGASTFPGYDASNEYFATIGENAWNEHHFFPQMSAGGAQDGTNDISMWNRSVNFSLPLPLPEKPVGYMVYFQPAGDCGLYGNCHHTEGNPIRNVINYVVTELKMGLVSLQNSPIDSYYWMQDGVNYDFTCKDDISNGQTCWNDGDNPDYTFLEFVFNKIKNNPHFDYDNVVVMGYSAGAQMASAVMGIFPSLTFKNDAKEIVKFPQVKAGFIVAGGSQYCYAYDLKKQNYLNAPPPFQPCPKPLDPHYTWDCCCHNCTERAYMLGELDFKDHPPTVLLQTQRDHNANPDGSRRYFAACKDNGFECVRIVGKGRYHGIVKEQEHLFAKLIYRYLTLDDSL